MDKEPQSGVQDEFINTIRKEKIQVTVYLLNGFKLQGRIRGFDKFSVLVDANGAEQLVFKHAISTIVTPRGVTHREKVEPAPAAERTEVS